MRKLRLRGIKHCVQGHTAGILGGFKQAPLLRAVCLVPPLLLTSALTSKEDRFTEKATDGKQWIDSPGEGAGLAMRPGHVPKAAFPTPTGAGGPPQGLLPGGRPSPDLGLDHSCASAPAPTWPQVALPKG